MREARAILSGDRRLASGPIKHVIYDHQPLPPRSFPASLRPFACSRPRSRHACSRVRRALAFARSLNALLLFTLTLHSRFLSPVLQAEFLHPARFLLPALSCASRSHLQERPCPQGIGTIQKTAKRLQNDCKMTAYECHTNIIRVPYDCNTTSSDDFYSPLAHARSVARPEPSGARYIQGSCVPSLFNVRVKHVTFHHTYIYTLYM